MSKIPLQGNGMDAISKIATDHQTIALPVQWGSHPHLFKKVHLSDNPGKHQQFMLSNNKLSRDPV